MKAWRSLARKPVLMVLMTLAGLLLLSACKRMASSPTPPMITPAAHQPADRLNELLAQLADIDDADRSVQAIELLEKEAVPAWLPRLHQALETPQNFVLREGVAPAVIRLQGMGALPRLIAALRLGLAEGLDGDSLMANVVELIESDPAGAKACLLPMADSADAADRADTAWLLAFVHAEVAPEVFIRLAGDESPRVRRAACGSLASLKGHEPAFQVLVQHLEDADEEVRISATSSLGYFGDARALPMLEHALSSAGERARPVLEHSISVLKK